jgi:hypothetical protein
MDPVLAIDGTMASTIDIDGLFEPVLRDLSTSSVTSEG